MVSIPIKARMASAHMTKNAGIVFYASYLHSYICAQEESNKQQFVD